MMSGRISRVRLVKPPRPPLPQSVILLRLSSLAQELGERGFTDMADAMLYLMSLSDDPDLLEQYIRQIYVGRADVDNAVATVFAPLSERG